jgi:hypothetical protein
MHGYKVVAAAAAAVHSVEAAGDREGEERVAAGSQGAGAGMEDKGTEDNGTEGMRSRVDSPNKSAVGDTAAVAVGHAAAVAAAAVLKLERSDCLRQEPQGQGQKLVGTTEEHLLAVAAAVGGSRGVGLTSALVREPLRERQRRRPIRCQTPRLGQSVPEQCSLWVEPQSLPPQCFQFPNYFGKAILK